MRCVDLIMNRVVTTIAMVFGAYLVVGALLGLFQRRLMYPVPGTVVVPKPAHGRLLKISGKSNPVYALYLPAPTGAPTVVHFHGNAEQLADQTGFGEEFRERRIGFFAVEYSGYGLARRESISEAALYDAAETALRYLESKLGVERGQTVILGRSLGTGVAVEMARRGFGERVVLISPFTSMVDMARRTAPLYPVGLLVKDRYDNQSKAPQIRIPVLIVHGREDGIIPFSMGQKLSETFDHAQLYAVDRAHHNDILAVGGSALFNCITDFVRQVSEQSPNH